MAVRVLLFTGKGGVGKTTTAAATAAWAAARGRKTLVLSTDPAHSLADAFAQPLGAEPGEVDTGLYAAQVDAQAAFERSWGEVQDYLRGMLARAGVVALQAEELVVLPGAEEVLALLELRAQVASGRWDLVVVDCAPTGETLRLLALPEALRWYVEKVFPAHRRALRAARPLLRGGSAVPGDGVLAAVQRLYTELGEVRELLTSPATSVRLVLTPEVVVVAESRRTLTSLALYGYRVDEVVANRVFPAGSSEPFLAAWAATQAEQLAAVRRDTGGLPVREQAYQHAEPVGLEALTALGASLYGDDDPAGDDPGGHDPGDRTRDLLDVRADGDGWVLTLGLPHVRREDVELSRSGDELVVTVAGHRRLLALPSLLRRCAVVGAALEGGRLRVRFVPDAEQWPETLPWPGDPR